MDCSTRCPGADPAAASEHRHGQAPVARAYVGQWVFLLVVIAVGGLLITTLGANLARRNMHFGFGFLVQRAGFDIPFHLIDWTIFDIYAKALLVSLLNTLLVSAMSIVAATLFGLLVGIMRLSVNWLVRNLALSFVEFVRNTPQLVQISLLVFRGPAGAPTATAEHSCPWRFPAQRPRPLCAGRGHARRRLAVALACLSCPGGDSLRLAIAAQESGASAPLRSVCRWSRRSCWSSESIASSVPALKGFNIVGGVQVPPELVALWAGLSIYATAFIAEIVRSSIEAVSKGQHEAARSLGLRPAHVLFLIVLPQALRIMVPQLTSQYLNLIKSSTLGAVVAYPDLFQIFAGTVMNQSGKEVETILIVMAVFLTINLLFSAFMNWYNRRVALVER